MAVWYSLWSFGIFSHFGMFGPRKNGNPVSMVAIENAKHRHSLTCLMGH
jgi:hypothetical protein